MGQRLLLPKPLLGAKIGQNVLRKRTQKFWNHSDYLVQTSFQNNRLCDLF